MSGYSRPYGEFKGMNDRSPPILTEGQTWRQYGKRAIEWLKLTSVLPHRTTATIAGLGLVKHPVIKQLAEGMVDNFSYMDAFEPEDLPRNWPREIWEREHLQYTPGNPEFNKEKYATLWDQVSLETLGSSFS